MYHSSSTPHPPGVHDLSPHTDGQWQVQGGRAQTQEPGCWLHSNCGCDSQGIGAGLGDVSRGTIA